MLKFFLSLTIIIMMLNLGDLAPIILDINDPEYFPPFKCEDQTTKSIEHGAALKVNIWPRGEVVYQIGDEFSPVDKRNILAGMQMIIDMTAVDGEPLIKFKQRTTEKNYVNVISDINKGCFSMIGMMGGPQVLSLAPGCLTTDTVAHEFIHALGFHHEQTRPDRDAYVEYHPENLADAFQRYNFEKNSNYLDLRTPYDVKSIMHYQSNAFAILGTNTLLSKNSPRVIQRNLVLSDTDVKEIRILYNGSTIVPAISSLSISIRPNFMILMFLFVSFIYQSLFYIHF